jgi:hypothetical protein
VAAALLLAFHPTLLRAAIAGPAEMLLAGFLYLLGSALYDLRARSGAPEVMAVALALLGLTFSHPMGAAFACAAVPLLVFAVRPELVASSAFNVVIALVFPTAFCVGAFAYMSWVFPGSGWSFLMAPAEGIATWSVAASQRFGGGLTGSLALDAGFGAALALALGAPLVLVAIAWVYRRRPLVAPAAVMIALTGAATFIAVATGLFGDPAAIAVVRPCALWPQLDGAQSVSQRPIEVRGVTADVIIVIADGEHRQCGKATGERRIGPRGMFQTGPYALTRNGVVVATKFDRLE